MRKLLKEWSEYLLNEVTMADADMALNSKKTLKVIKGFRYNREKEAEQFGRQYYGATAESQHKNFQSSLLSLIPNDLEEKQKASAILWLLGVARNDAGISSDFIEQKTSDYRGVPNSLETFYHHQRFMPQQDLNSIKSIRDLETMAAGARDAIQKDQEKKDYLDAEQGIEIFRDDDEWKIAALHNKGAACELGKNTDWCTAAPGLDYFKDYYEPEDPLFYFQNKSNLNKFQFHYGKEQFMDARDQPVDLETEERLHNLLRQTDAPKKYKVVATYFNRATAKNPSTPPEVLAVLAKDENLWVRQNTTENPNTPPEALAILAKDKSPGIRRSTAKNPNTPPEALARIAKDEDRTVRGQTAGNPSTPPEALATLAKDKGSWVRLLAAKNPNTPPEALAVLARDEEDAVRSITAANPNTPPEALAVLARDKAYRVRLSAVRNPNTPPEVLAILAKDEDSHIRRVAAGNPNTPKETDLNETYKRWSKMIL